MTNRAQHLMELFGKNKDTKDKRVGINRSYGGFKRPAPTAQEQEDVERDDKDRAIIYETAPRLAHAARELERMMAELCSRVSDESLDHLYYALKEHMPSHEAADKLTRYLIR